MYINLNIKIWQKIFSEDNLREVILAFIFASGKTEEEWETVDYQSLDTYDQSQYFNLHPRPESDLYDDFDSIQPKQVRKFLKKHNGSFKELKLALKYCQIFMTDFKTSYLDEDNCVAWFDFFEDYILSKKYSRKKAFLMLKLKRTMGNKLTQQENRKLFKESELYLKVFLELMKIDLSLIEKLNDALVEEKISIKEEKENFIKQMIEDVRENPLKYNIVEKSYAEEWKEQKNYVPKAEILKTELHPSKAPENLQVIIEELSKTLGFKSIPFEEWIETNQLIVVALVSMFGKDALQFVKIKPEALTNFGVNISYSLKDLKSVFRNKAFESPEVYPLMKSLLERNSFAELKEIYCSEINPLYLKSILTNEFGILPINVKANKMQKFRILVDFLANKNLESSEQKELFNEFIFAFAKYYRVDPAITLERQVEILKSYWELFQRRNQNSAFVEISGRFGEYSYEIMNKNNPELLFIGDATDCCQHLKGGAMTGRGAFCMSHAILTDKSDFLVIKKRDKIISQSWIFPVEYNDKKLFVFDSIETLGSKTRTYSSSIYTIISNVIEKVFALNNNEYEACVIGIDGENVPEGILKFTNTERGIALDEKQFEMQVSDFEDKQSKIALKAFKKVVSIIKEDFKEDVSDIIDSFSSDITRLSKSPYTDIPDKGAIYYTR